jgi:hypothetical protein
MRSDAATDGIAPPDLSALAAWIGAAHRTLADRSTERAGAAWGPIRLRHRSARSEWFGAFDRSWAQPLHAPAAKPSIDLVTGAFADLPPTFDLPPLRRAHLGERREVWATEGSRIRMIWDLEMAMVLAWDADSGLAVHLTAQEPNGYDQVSPLRLLVHWATCAAGGVLIHGAGVGRADDDALPRGLLILGDAGYGKSTSTLACLRAGWVTCGDDAVAAFPVGGGWQAAAVYSAVKTKVDRGEYPSDDLDVVTWTIDGHKRAHLLTATDETLLVPAMALDAVVLLDPAGDPDMPWRPLTAAAARTLAAPSTVVPLTFDGQTVLRRIGELTEDLATVQLPRRSTLAATVADLESIRLACRPGAGRRDP